MYKAILYIAILVLACLFNCTAFAQSQKRYDNGFQEGFKEGFCYGSPIYCIAPLTPMTPMIRLGEDMNNYTQGYNRGFQVGLDLQRISDTYNPYKNNQVTKIDYSKIRTPYRSSDYVIPFDLNKMADVLTYKEALFQSRAKWVQQKLEDIYDLAYSTLKPKSEEKFFDLKVNIDMTVKLFNSKPRDFTNNSTFKEITDQIKAVEEEYYNLYKEVYNK